jgi:tetratricopeptide (TPR) repeat protein
MPDGGAEWESLYEKMSNFLSIEGGTLRAHASLMLKEYDDAIDNATRVVAFCNKNDTWNKACWGRYQEANYVRGTAYLSKGEPEQAISVLLWVKKNSEIFGGPARYNLGVGYYNLGQFVPRSDNPYMYARKSDSLFFGKARLASFEHLFYQGRLVAIYAGTKGPDNQKALMKELEVQYGALKSHPGKPGEYYWPSFAPREGASVELSCMWEQPRAAGERYTPAAEKIIEERGCTLFIKDVKGYQDYVLRKK